MNTAYVGTVKAPGKQLPEVLVVAEDHKDVIDVVLSWMDFSSRWEDEDGSLIHALDVQAWEPAPGDAARVAYFCSDSSYVILEMQEVLPRAEE